MIVRLRCLPAACRGPAYAYDAFLQRAGDRRTPTMPSCSVQETGVRLRYLPAACRRPAYAYDTFLQRAGDRRTPTIPSCSVQEIGIRLLNC
ncbi:hypothetical protein [Porphyromonas loveana]|uniref:hypothetical protein n=1 Tax=Porphyromonas loveana TaxID=1884669 RepID=UPI00359F36F4